jgi:RND family efflux transporter MFP subunit
MQQLTQWSTEQAVPTVSLAQIEPAAATQTLSLPGSIEPYSRAPIYARVNGYLNSWKRDIGAQVKAGEVLASIDTPDLDQQLAQAKAVLATAQATYQLALTTAQRWDVLLKKGIVAQQVADEKNGDAAAKKAAMEAAQANVRQLEATASFKTIVAPFDGVVTARTTDIGALINSGSAGQPLFEVSDVHRVRIYVQVPQAFSGQLRPGLKASFEMPQYRGRPFEATLVTTSNSLNVSSRSMRVELQADNPDGTLVPGTYCTVQFEIPGDPEALRVPATALVAGHHGMQVAVLGPDGKVAFKPVQIGRDLGDVVEVASGLALSDRVVDSPPESLQAGSPVRVANASPPAAPRLAAASPSGG